MKLDVPETVMNMLPPADWAGELERMQEALRNERDRNLRTLADFKNYRRHIEREGNSIAEQVKREMLLRLLEIADDMGKALRSTAGAEQSAIKGIRLVQKKYLALLESYGVVPMECIGLPFDHALHEAVTMTKHHGTESGTVIDELRRGYLWHNEVLRAAQVRVAE